MDNASFMRQDVEWILKYCDSRKEEEEKHKLISSAAGRCLDKAKQFKKDKRLLTLKDLFMEYLHSEIDTIKRNVANALIKAKNQEKEKKYFNLVKQFDVVIEKKEEKENKSSTQDDDEDDDDVHLMVKHQQHVQEKKEEEILVKYGKSRHIRRDTGTYLHYMSGKKDELNIMKLLDYRYFAKGEYFYFYLVTSLHFFSLFM